MKDLKIGSLALLGFLMITTFLITEAKSKPLSGDVKPERGLIVVPDQSHGTALMHAVSRLKAKSPISLDFVDGSLDPRVKFGDYKFTIVLGVTGDNKRLMRAWSGDQPNEVDAWALKTISQEPLVIVATGNRPRAVLYAVWDLADKLAQKEDVTALDKRKRPKIENRYAGISGSAFGGWGKDNRHTLYMSTIEELPRYGINGVFLSPGYWRVGVGPGKVPPPIDVKKDGSVDIDQSKVAEWRTMFETIESYDLESMIMVEPFVHPSFNPQKILKKYYIEGKKPNGYLKKLRTFYRNYLTTLLDAFPQLDGLALHAGIEGSQYSGDNAHSPRMFLHGHNMEATSAAMSIYLSVLEEVAKERNINATFWTHQWTIDSEGIRAMRKVLFKHPTVTIIEDDYWPNNLWINGGRIPIMKYLPEDIRDETGRHNPLGMMSITDAEYYGGGALPNAYGEPFVLSMQQLIKREGYMAILRLNLHDRTPFGTLWNMSEIQIAQASRQLWEPTKSPETVWKQWIKRRYGRQAAPFISKALKNSQDIIFNGFTLDGMNALHHSRVSAREWLPSWPSGEGKFKMFAKPGTPINPKTEGEAVESIEQFASQLDLEAFSFSTFKERNSLAKAKVEESFKQIEKAKPELSRPEYAYLSESFQNARILLKVIFKMGQAAYATNLMQDNFDKVEDPEVFFDNTMQELKEYSASQEVQWLSNKRKAIHGDVSGEMMKIYNGYKKYVNGL